MSRSSASLFVKYCRQNGLASALALLPTVALATNMSAGVVMDKMSSDQRFSFIAGIVEGLATSRYVADGKKIQGMKCIFEWFFGKGDGDVTTVETIYAAFKRYPDYPPGTVVDVMARKACPG